MCYDKKVMKKIFKIIPIVLMLILFFAACTPTVEAPLHFSDNLPWGTDENSFEKKTYSVGMYERGVALDGPDTGQIVNILMILSQQAQ